MILVLFTVMIELAAARGVVAVLANSGIIGLSTYSTNLLTLLVIAAGTDYAIFILGRYHEARSAGQDRESSLLYDVPRDRAHYLGFGPDDCRRGVLSELHPAAVFSKPRHSRRDRRPRRAGGRADPGARGADHRPPFRAVRPQAQDAHPGLAAHRHGHRALARTHPGRDVRGGR